MLDIHKYYCKVFLNKGIDAKDLEVLMGKLIKKGTNTYACCDISINLNKAAMPPLGKIDDDNFLFWKFFLDIEPVENITRDSYVKGIIELMRNLRNNGFQVLATCDFEDELPRYDNKNFVLAYRIYPEPQGTIYYKSDLVDEKNVEILFDYCQIGQAIINKAGWEFLIDFYGYEKLFEINERSGWFWADDMDDFLEYIKMYMGYSEGEG